MNKIISRKTIILSVAALLLIGSFLYLKFINSTNQTNSPSEIVTADGQTVNLEPPTEQEEAETKARKEEIVKKSEQENRTSGTADATLVIANASKSSVSAYISGVIEDGGTCTATATSGSFVINKSSTGFANAKNTQCEPLIWNTELSAATWTINVKYSSTATSASSSTSIKVN